MKNIIVFVNSFKSGGSNKVGVNASNILKEKNNVKLISLYNGEIGFEGVENVEHLCLSKNTSNNSFIKILNLFKGIFIFLKEILKFKPDKIVTFNMETTFIALVLKLISFSKYEVIMTQHEEKIFINQFTALSGLIYKFFLYSIRFLQFYIKVIICVSENVKDTMLFFGFNEDKLKVIYNSVDIDKIKMLSEEFCEIKEPFIVNIANYSEIKNQLFLIRSFSLISNLVPENLKFFGSGKDSLYFEELKTEVAKLGLEDRIIFGDYVNNSYKYITHARVLCSSSFTESFGLTLIEGMALGVPVISTEHGGAKEILGNSEYGICSPFDENIYSQKLLKLLKDDSEYEKYIHKGLQRVKKFSSSNQYTLLEEYI